GIRDFHVTGVQTCALPISDKPGVATAPGQAQTDEEKVRALHQELSERFAKFDRTILSETEKVRQDDAASGNRGFSDRDPFQKGEIGRASCRERGGTAQVAV